MKRLAVLGSTGSIGVTTLSVVERFPDRFRVVALAAGKNLERLKEQVRRFQPEVVSIASEADARDLHAHLPGFRGEILCGAEGLVAGVAPPPPAPVRGAPVRAGRPPPPPAAARHGGDHAPAPATG